MRRGLEWRPLSPPGVLWRQGPAGRPRSLLIRAPPVSVAALEYLVLVGHVEEEARWWGAHLVSGGAAVWGGLIGVVSTGAGPRQDPVSGERLRESRGVENSGCLSERQGAGRPSNGTTGNHAEVHSGLNMTLPQLGAINRDGRQTHTQDVIKRRPVLHVSDDIGVSVPGRIADRLR